MYYDDLEYANKRLAGTLVRDITGSPFVVSSVDSIGGKFVCFGTHLVSQQTEAVPLEKIDLTPVPLGFFNHEYRMYFSCRKPMRSDWKQGLSNKSLLIYGTTDRFGFGVLTQPILNTYPKLNRALEILSKRVSGSVAFSRDFGIAKKDKELLLFYRKYEVGKVEKNLPVLNRDKFFLGQHLEEVVG